MADYKQQMNNYVKNGGKTTDSAYRNLESQRNNKIMSTDWQGKINSTNSQYQKKAYNDIRNEKIAMNGGQGGSGAPAWLGNAPQYQPQGIGQPQYQDYQTPDYSAQMDAINEAKRQSTINGLTKARDNALSGLKTQEEAVKPNYYNARNKVAAQSDVGAMNFAQYMASRGVQGNAAAMPEMYRNAGLQSQIGALDQQEASDLSGIERNRASIGANYENDIASAQADITAVGLQNYVAQMNADRAFKTQQEAVKKNDFDNTIGAYSNDFMAQINALKARGYSDDSYEIRALLSARNDKLNADELQQARAKSMQDENSPSYATALQAYNRGIRTEQILKILGL